MESRLDSISQSFNVHYSNWVREALDELPDNFTVTDPSIPGHPIVYASHGFLKMCGYSKDEVIGRNGRIFQGPGTNRRSVVEIREAIREERAIQTNLLNYRKDGTPFWILFHMSPVFSKDGERVSHFVAVQVPLRRRWRKRRCSRSEFGRNGVNSCEDGSGLQEIVYGSCRRELCTDPAIELRHTLAQETVFDSDNAALDIEEPCEASDLEKQNAVTAINNILSVLIHYSESTNSLVCGKRCSVSGTGLLASSLLISLGRIKQSFVLTDPHSPDNPIVYASDAFLGLTGYARHEVLGRNYRFLSGADTDSTTLEQIDESVRNDQRCTVRILNCRKDKSSFWNLLHLSPVRNASGKIAYFVGVYAEEDCSSHDEQGLSVQMKQFSVVGAVRVAVRSLSMSAGPSKA